MKDAHSRHVDWFKHLEWLEKIERDGVNLSTWEIDFVDVVGDQLRANRNLSERQAEILERIYTEKTP